MRRERSPLTPDVSRFTKKISPPPSPMVFGVRLMVKRPAMNLPELLEKFAKNEATPAEREAFSAHLAGLGSTAYQQILDTYGDIVRTAGVTAAPDKTLLAAIQQHITSDDYKEDPVPKPSPVVKIPVRNRRWLYYGAAAAILIAAATASRLFIHKKPAAISGVAGAIPIPPATNKAILTLASGQQILLDDAGQGAVASQGSIKIIKINKGVLAYRGSATGSRPAEYNTIATPRGGQYELLLPDGTHAWLNAASSLRFPVSFAGKERKVTLTGEGYFAVAPDAAHPFVVSFDNTDITVLGTEFNIKAYDEEPVTQSTLVSGRIRLTRGAQSVLPEAGKMAITARGDQQEPVQVIAADIEQVTAWKNGKMALTNANLVTLMREVSRWYDVDVHYTGAVPDKHFFGLVNRNVYLNTILGFLRKNGVRVQQEGRHITIFP